ncbi:max dimerization protein 3 [Motacilla alba alba]|uniref:max dimerization protein 3 n=1 Tax=Motacilla alba alba TaxID=1094192 RepID=UPI0018D59AF7|nr:max dimerization protein 3 [Motacilla alba alba]
MEPAGSRIQVLLQAAEFLELLEHRGHPHPLGLAEAEHGYAALCPAPSRRAVGSVRSVHNALEKHRRAQLRCCLERLKQQVPLGVGPSRSTTLSLLHRARLHIQRLQEQELRARRAKDRLRDRQRSLQRRLESLLSPADGERARADSLDSSQLSEPSEEEDAEVEVDGVVFSGDLLPSFGTGRDHSYSSPHSPAS